MDNFSEFYRRYRHSLLGYLIRMTSDVSLAMDIVQESFLRYLDRYGPNKSNRPLLFKIARNALIDASRKEKRHRLITAAEKPMENDPETNYQVRAEYQRVLAGMQQLDKAEREILALTVSRDLSYRAIGEITGLSAVNVRVKVHRARLKLKQILQRQEEEI
jgi:RNA polymerase sigma factor (sigma-70 family)